jgi:hypothetical protein
VNNFTVLFHFFMGMSKSVFSICLGSGWFRMKEQISAFSEFCNVCARPVFFKFRRKHPDAAASWGAARSQSALGAAMA